MGHIFLLVRRRTWYFIPFVIGCLCAFLPSSVVNFLRRRAPQPVNQRGCS
jgi:hypothetical protein